jgi:predicted ATP-grasp superfamily ATP-dependent carboligase
MSARVDRTRTPAVVMGLGPGGLGVVRSLARLGVEVYAVYPGTGADVGRHSRLLRGRYPTRPGITDTELLASVRRIRRRISPARPMVLIPANDRYARFAATHRAELREDFVLRTPPAGLETAFLDKRTTATICTRGGVPIPTSCVPDRMADVEQAAAALHFPAIIKPAFQEDPSFPGKNAVVSGPAELLSFYRDHPELIARSMFQELVPSGDGHIVGINTYSGADGRVLAWTSHRRLRQWLPDRGATCYGVTETLDTLRERTVRFLDGLGYVGWAGVEYAEDVETGEYRFLELNARVVLPNQLFADAGVDLTAIGYLEMCGEAVPECPRQRDGVYWMDFHRDLPSSLLRWHRGQLCVREWLRSLRSVSSHATFDPHDPKPFAATLVLMASVLVGRTRGRQRAAWRTERPAPLPD